MFFGHVPCTSSRRGPGFDQGQPLHVTFYFLKLQRTTLRFVVDSVQTARRYGAVNEVDGS